jgi:hypothetical protein
MATETLSTKGLDTLTVMPRHNKPKSWTMADQLQLDAKVKKEQMALRESKKEDKGASNLMRMPV